MPGAHSTVQFIFIDTVTLAGKTNLKIREWKPSGPEDPALAQDELKWITHTLQQSKADWIIMAGHYPGTFVYIMGVTKVD